MANAKYKIIIVGGGPAGSMTALSILRLRPELAGNILILEAKAFPREKVCGGGVSGRVTTYLEGLGVSLEKLPKVPVNGFSVFCRDESHHTPFKNDKGFVLRRSAFDQLLLDEAERRGAEVRTATPAVGAYRERRGVVVLGRDGDRYRGDVLVAADGVNGRSRTWFSIPPGSRKTLLLQTTFPRDPDVEPLRDNLMMDFSPPEFGIKGYVWFFPSIGEQGEPVVNAGISGGEWHWGSYAQLREAFLAILDRHPEIKAMSTADLHFKPYPERGYSPLRALALRSYARSRIIFVGEQVGVDPFTGEGLSFCADSSQAASREIVDALERGDFSFRGYSRRLLRAEFFPLYLIGKTYWIQAKGPQPNFLFTAAIRELPPGMRNILDYYAGVFSARDESDILYTGRFWADALRDLGAVLPEWLAKISGTSSSRR